MWLRIMFSVNYEWLELSKVMHFLSNNFLIPPHLLLAAAHQLFNLTENGEGREDGKRARRCCVYNDVFCKYSTQ